MKEFETLFDKAKQNYKVAKIIYSTTASDDEAYLNYVGYHLQQSVEFTLKYILEMNGIEYPKSHDIEQLIRLANKNNVNLYLTEYIEEHSEMFSSWEAKTRYILNYRLEEKKINKAIEELEKYLEIVENEFLIEVEIIDEK